MSEYDYDDAPRRRRSHRTREPEYVTETTYIQRGPGQPSRDLVYRGREDSIEDIERDFPPPGARRRSGYSEYDYPPRRARSVGRRDRYDDDYSDYAPGVAAAAGAGAGYAAGRARRRRDDRDDGYYSDDYDRPRHDRRKSGTDKFIEGLGLGGLVGAVTGRKSRSRSRSRGGHDRYGSDSDRSHKSTRSRGGRDKSHDKRKKWQQAATAAVIAGAVEGYRARKEPNKGTRIATAALASAGLDSFLDRNPDEHKKRHVLESVVGGLAANRIANGPRSKSRGRDRDGSRSPSAGGFRSRSRSIMRSFSRGRGRSRSDSRSPARDKSHSRLKQIAVVGGVAAAGKAIYDRVRSKSRGRARSASRSRSGSEDSYVPSRRQRYQTDRRGPGGEDDDGRSQRSGGGERGRGRNDDGSSNSGSKKRDKSSTSISTTDLENQKKRSRTKELLTAAFATVATIHAGHNVFTSMQASEQRHKAVAAGEITKEQARKQKSKNMLQDAAAIGIAALGIKGAFTEWKEMNEKRHEVQELEDKRRKRRKRTMQRRKEEKQALMMHGGAGGFAGYGMPYGYPPPGGPMPVYADGNPYAVGNQLPMPPTGPPPARVSSLPSSSPSPHKHRRRYEKSRADRFFDALAL